MQIEICFGYIWIQIVFNPARIRLVLQHLVLTATTFTANPTCSDCDDKM